MVDKVDKTVGDIATHIRVEVDVSAVKLRLRVSNRTDARKQGRITEPMIARDLSRLLTANRYVSVSISLGTPEEWTSYRMTTHLVFLLSVVRRSVEDLEK